ncbi:MAG: prephenate dehydrogenase/arogenate dehydrogenase family protein [Clostridia bacterium]|nr:prephenate dehydrogenase/arogenate dehydrogenase family protein [Clostridia bacterium]
MNVGIVGLGLIGGSLARAIKQAGYRVLGTDINRSVLLKAKMLEIVDEDLTDENLSECQVVLLGIYPQATVDWVRAHEKLIEKDTVVMDTCGVKTTVCYPCWESAERGGFTFVGGHPMEGAAKIGFDHSTGTMFKRASMILCPKNDILLEKVKLLKDVLDAAGFGRYEITTPEHHDEMIALTSQLAHVVSSAFVKADNAGKHKGYSAGSFRDMTRVAYLNETMWTELFLDNRENLLCEVSGLIDRLGEYQAALEDGDAERLKALLKDGRETKQRIDREDRK